MLPNVALSTASAALLLVAVVRPGARRARRWIPVMLAVIAAAYLPIALTRDAFQGVLRYHYVTDALGATALGVALSDLSGRGSGRRVLDAACVGGIATVAWLLGTRPYPVDHHDFDRAETAATLARIDQAAQRTDEPPLVPNKLFGPAGALEAFEPEGRFPGIAAVYVAFRSSRDDRGAIRFVSRSPAEYAFAMRRGGRIATLLVPPAPSTVLRAPSFQLCDAERCGGDRGQPACQAQGRRQCAPGFPSSSSRTAACRCVGERWAYRRGIASVLYPTQLLA
jgi:hypothetical protein